MDARLFFPTSDTREPVAIVRRTAGCFPRGRHSPSKDRGRDGAVSATPPSKPDRRFSRIRLSSQWVLRREGAALRLVPKRAGQTFGITQANCTRLIPPLASPRGHSRWFSFPSFFPSHFHLPASLGSTVVTRFSATTDALTPVSRARGLLARFAHQHRRVSLVTTLGLPTIPSPTIGVMTGDRPAVRRFSSRLSPALQASSFPSRLAHPRRPNRVHGGCSIEQPVLRTGRSGSVALHFLLPRRSYGSIPHGSSPHRSRLPLPYPNAIPGALGLPLCGGPAPFRRGTAPTAC